MFVWFSGEGAKWYQKDNIKSEQYFPPYPFHSSRAGHGHVLTTEHPPHQIIKVLMLSINLQLWMDSIGSTRLAQEEGGTIELPNLWGQIQHRAWDCLLLIRLQSSRFYLLQSYSTQGWTEPSSQNTSARSYARFLTKLAQIRRTMKSHESKEKSYESLLIFLVTVHASMIIFWAIYKNLP